ncbi:MAG: hypothetical protein ABI067_17725 [Leifsonia sp.]
MYQAFVCETVTGNYLSPLDCNIKSWKRELTGADMATVDLNPGAITTANRDLLRLLTTPWRTLLIIEWINPGEIVGTPVYAGPFVADSFDGSVVTLNASSIRAILAKRKLINWTGPYQTQVTGWSNMSLGSIGISLTQFACSQAGESLPILFPSTETDTDPTHVKNYNGYNLKNADSALTDLGGLINGPEFDFQPVWADVNRSGIRFQMRAGTNEQPNLTSPTPISYDATQPGSAVQKLTYLRDASQVVTRQWGNGSGTDVDTLMSTATNATLVNAGWPVLEGQKDHKSETIQVQLDKAVAGDLAVAQNPIIQFGLVVDGSQKPFLGTYPLGATAMVNVRNHIWVPDSPAAGYPMRVIAMSGDSSTKVTLAVQGA